MIVFGETCEVALLPLAVILALVALHARPYRRLADPVACFRRTVRPASLRRVLTAALAGGGLVYVALVAVRVRILAGLVLAATEGDSAGSVPLGIALFTGVIFLCELVVVAHLFFYIRLCRDGVARYRLAEIPALEREPPKAALLIPACDERPETLARPLESLNRIRYQNCRVILVENSRDPECKRAALELANALRVEVLDTRNRGTKAAALNDALAVLDADTEYVAVLDADQQLCDDMISDLVALLEVDPEAAWVQTPQVYVDAAGSLLRTGATQQLLVLYDSVLQGKDVRGVCPMLGTNFVLRREALEVVGGWDERFVNEDTATSYRIQLEGLKGRYRERPYAAGLGPSSITALWRQQRRWAHSNSKLAFSIMAGFFRGERRDPRVVADYLALTSYELLSFLIAMLAIVPSLALVTAGLLVSRGSVEFPALTGWQWAFASLYPFHLILLFFPHVNLGLRGYPLRNLLLMQGLVACLAPVYLQGVKLTLLGKKVIFESPMRGNEAVRGAANRQRAGWFAPQSVAFLLFLVLGSIAFAIALEYPASPFGWIVAFWAAFHALCTGHYLLFVAEERRGLRTVHPRTPPSQRSELPATDVAAL